MSRFLFVFMLLSTGAAMAAAPEQSLRPVARSGAELSASAPAVMAIEGTETTATSEKPRGLFRSLRPLKRSERVVKTARTTRAARRRGMVCGDVDIQGEFIGRVPGKINGCGVSEAVRVRSVSGVALSQHSVMDCGTAKALKRWVDKGMQPAMKRKGGGVASIKVVAHYACRTRNNKRGAKISEHGKGRAIDIAGFTLRDGSKVTVLNDWRSRKYGKALRNMHKSACGPFGTVLGPEANKYHRDHFHFDTARYRSGSYCR